MCDQSGKIYEPLTASGIALDRSRAHSVRRAPIVQAARAQRSEPFNFAAHSQQLFLARLCNICGCVCVRLANGIENYLLTCCSRGLIWAPLANSLRRRRRGREREFVRSATGRNRPSRAAESESESETETETETETESELCASALLGCCTHTLVALTSALAAFGARRDAACIARRPPKALCASAVAARASCATGSQSCASCASCARAAINLHTSRRDISARGRATLVRA